MASNVLYLEDYRKRQVTDTREYLQQVTNFVTANLSVHQEVVDRGTVLLDILDELLCKPHIINDKKKDIIETKMFEIFGTRLIRSIK